LTQIARFLPGRLSSSPITTNHGRWTHIKSDRDGLYPLQVERNYTNLPRIRSWISETLCSVVLIYALAIKKSPPITYEMLQLWPANSCCCFFSWAETLFSTRYRNLDTAFELQRRSGSISNLGAPICSRPHWSHIPSHVRERVPILRGKKNL